MIYRLVKLPLAIGSFMIELAKIKEIASTNGFDLSVVDNLVKKHSLRLKRKQLSTFFASPAKQLKKLKPVKFGYMPPGTNKIKTIYKDHNLFDVVFSTSTKLKQLLGTTKDKQLTYEKSGIYKVTCNVWKSLPWTIQATSINTLQRTYCEHQKQQTRKISCGRTCFTNIALKFERL